MKFNNFVLQIVEEMIISLVIKLKQGVSVASLSTVTSLNPFEIISKLN